MTNTPSGLTVELAPPPGWGQIPRETDAPAGDVALFAPADWRDDWGLRPSITVAVGADGAAGSVRVLLTETVASVRAMGSGARVMAVDLWQDDAGRRLLHTRPQGEALVCVTTWMRVVAGRPVSITATVDADRYLRVMPLVEQSVAGAALPEGTGPTSEPTSEPASGSGSWPVSPGEPRRDGFWAGQGETLEDLGRLVDVQPWVPQGWALSRAAWSALALAGRGLIRGLRVTGPEVQELADADLVDARGRLTKDGEALHTVLTGARRRIRVESSAAGISGVFEAAVLDGTALVWATEGPRRAAQPAPAGEGLRGATCGTVLWLPTMHLPAQLAAWIGLGPAWPMATSPGAMPRAVLDRRTGDPTAPPPADADDHLREVWSQPWSTWSLVTDTGHAVAAVQAGRHGTFRLLDVAPEDPPRTSTQDQEQERVQLTAWPAVDVFAVLVGVSML